MTRADSMSGRTPARRAELAFATVALLLVVSLHAVFFLRAGALWRDEINSVNIARLGSWDAIVANLEYDSFPAGWFVALRPLALQFQADEAVAFRIFGVAMGLLLVATVTFAGVDMTGRPPIVAISLLLLNATVIRFGDSLRGYGLGMLFAALCYWALWRYSKYRTFPSAVFALLATLAGVHVLYYNAFVAFGACCAAAIACLVSGARRAAVGALAIGAAAAASLVPYASVFRRARSWNDLVRFDIGSEWVHRMGAWSIAHSGMASLVLWYTALAFGVAAAVFFAIRISRRLDVAPSLAFHAVALVLGSAAYLVFLLRLGYYMAPWYYLALMVLAAMAADALFAAVAREKVRITAVLLLCAHLALSYGPVSRYLSQEATNLPRLAAEIAARTGPDDLVVVTPWELGVSWNLYYAGAARWKTVPPIGFFDWHRYDLFYRELASPASTNSVLREIDATLAANRRVIIVTMLDYPAVPGPQPEPLTNAGVPARQLISHLEGKRYRLATWPRNTDTIGYERGSAIEVFPSGPAN